MHIHTHAHLHKGKHPSNTMLTPEVKSHQDEHAGNTAADVRFAGKTFQAAESPDLRSPRDRKTRCSILGRQHWERGEGNQRAVKEFAL